jgi:hypothetical protein
MPIIRLGHFCFNPLSWGKRSRQLNCICIAGSSKLGKHLVIQWQISRQGAAEICKVRFMRVLFVPSPLCGLPNLAWAASLVI